MAYRHAHSCARTTQTTPPARPCASDDVDDQYTERGRGLLRKEAEAAASGMRIGDILHSNVIDLEFPGLGPKRERVGREGWGANGARARAQGRPWPESGAACEGPLRAHWGHPALKRD